MVTDYKTGRRPVEPYEQGRLGGVHFYALLCEELLGRRPAASSCSTSPSRWPSPPCPPSSRPAASAQGRGHLAGGRAGLRARGLPAQAVPAVRLVRLPGSAAPRSAATPTEARRGLRPGGRRRPSPPPATASRRTEPRTAERPTPSADRTERHAERDATPEASSTRPSSAFGEQHRLEPPAPSSDRRAASLAHAVARLRRRRRRPVRPPPGHPPSTGSCTPLTELGDFSLIWHLLAVARGLRSDRRRSGRCAPRRRARRRVGRGQRPDQVPVPAPAPRVRAPRPYRLRIPLTTSFPSGHASAAMLRRRAAGREAPPAAAAALLRPRRPGGRPAGCT